MPKGIGEGNLDNFTVSALKKIKMSDCADNLTRKNCLMQALMEVTSSEQAVPENPG